MTLLRSLFPAAHRELPAIVSESLVGLSHAVHVFLLLHRRTTAVGGIEQLIGQLVDHALFATGAPVSDEPANGQRGAALGSHFDRHLVVGAADAAGLHFQKRLAVLDGLLEELEGFVAAALF